MSVDDIVELFKLLSLLVPVVDDLLVPVELLFMLLVDPDDEPVFEPLTDPL